MDKIIYVCWNCEHQNILDFEPQDDSAKYYDSPWDNFTCEECGKKRTDDPIYKEPFET